MNEANRKLFFDEDNEEIALLTVTDESGTDSDMELIALLEMEELDREFVMARPVDTPDEAEQVECVILEYREDENGDPSFLDVEDEQEFAMVAQAFEEFFNEESEEIPEEEAEEVFLHDLGDYVPGVSIQED